MTSIRERDAKTTWPAEVPGCELDRRALLTVGDALAEVAREVFIAEGGDVRLDHWLDLRNALAHWKAITG